MPWSAGARAFNLHQERQGMTEQATCYHDKELDCKVHVFKRACRSCQCGEHKHVGDDALTPWRKNMIYYMKRSQKARGCKVDIKEGGDS